MTRATLVSLTLIAALLLTACQPILQVLPPQTPTAEAPPASEPQPTTETDSVAAPTAEVEPTVAPEPAQAEAPPAGQEITNITWQWARYSDTADGNDIDVPDPANYSLLLLPDGTVQIRVDCNQVGGTYSLDGNSLTIGLGPSTQAFCGEESLDQQYLALLGDVVSYELDGVNLVLNLQADAGNMIFERARSLRGPQIEGLTITPDQIQLNVEGLAESWQAVVVPATPYDQSQPPGPTGLPEHMQIVFDGIDPQKREPRDPVLYIIPAAAYATSWLENGNPATAQTMLWIDDVSYVLPSPAPTSSYPALPVEEVGSGLNDLSVQVGRIPATESSATKNGYRFVGRWMQDPNPVTNQNLRYVYQGYTNDGQYLVSFWYPARTAALPDEVSELSAEQQEQFANDSLAYIAGEAERLNNLSPADWEPDLDRLSALVASLRIEGMPVHGLQGQEWLWATTVNTGQEEPPVAEPQKYRLIFSSEDTVDVVADCIAVSGTYAAEGGQSGRLTWELPIPDNTDCGPDSLSGQFLSFLPAIQDYRVRVAGNVLELPMPAGGPVLIFGRATN